ncbi:hypothetical protein CFB3_11690 [Clostridium folliculivorans]|uniref:Uncharacterized protein n=1 Tax=Clostridium folliculivorans TaxID=2886038 RepID=A0A9W6DBJ8_9CLOT|nr:hypothetical protein CFOLD11_33320 [Clostridium folliculivorans]GKU29063.1 hypothetical protein CFB3_11690 [Clostridium folliculivorans]
MYRYYFVKIFIIIFYKSSKSSIKLKFTADDKNSAFYAQLFTDLGLNYLSDDYTIQ